MHDIVQPIQGIAQGQISELVIDIIKFFRWGKEASRAVIEDVQFSKTLYDRIYRLFRCDTHGQIFGQADGFATGSGNPSGGFLAFAGVADMTPTLAPS